MNIPLIILITLSILIAIPLARMLFGNPTEKVDRPILPEEKEKLREKIERLKTSGVHLLDAVYELQDRSLAAILTLEEIALWVKGWSPSLLKERLPFIIEPHLALCNTNSDFDLIEKTIGVNFTGKILGGYSEAWLKVSPDHIQASRRFRMIGEPVYLHWLIEHFGFQGLKEAGRDLDKIRTVSYYFKFVYIYDSDWGNTHCPVYDAAIHLADKITAEENAVKIPSSTDLVWLVGILRKTTVPTEHDKPVQGLYSSALKRAIEVSRTMELAQITKVINEAEFYWSKTPVNAILESRFSHASLSAVNEIIGKSEDKRLLSLAEERRKQLLRAI